MSPQPILIVDDDSRTAAELGQMLTALGYAVAGAPSSGPDAIAHVAAAEPRLVLIDATLAGELDGVETARRIRRRSTVPILFTVDEGDEAAMLRASARAANGYLLKPFAERELRVGVAHALAAAGARGGVDELEERFFAVSIDLLCCLGFDGHFKRLSPSWEHTLGFTREELMARPFIEFVHPDDRARTLAQNREVRGGGQALSFENRYLCRDGSYRWLLWNAAPALSEHIIYSVARDVTAIKRAAAEREELVRELQTALAEVRTLQEILPICSYCKKIRDDEHYWHTVEAYVSRHTNTRFSHSICPTCYEEKVVPELEALEGE